MIKLTIKKMSHILFLIKDYSSLDQQIPKLSKKKKINKKFQYLFLLKKFDYIINTQNLFLLKFFLTKYGKIQSRRVTNLNMKLQKKISKLIKHYRSEKLFPATFNVKI
jgi:ribosomal protein S18